MKVEWWDGMQHAACLGRATCDDHDLTSGQHNVERPEGAPSLCHCGIEYTSDLSALDSKSRKLCRG